MSPFAVCRRVRREACLGLLGGILLPLGLLAAPVGSQTTVELPSQADLTATAVGPGPTATESAAPALEGAPVVVAGRDVFRIRQREGSLSAAERAKLLSRRLEALASNPFRTDPVILVVDTDSGTDIVADGEVLVTVTDTDARAYGLARVALAEAAAERMRDALAEARSLYSVRAVLIRLAQAVVALLVLGLALWLVNRLFRLLRRQLPRIFYGQAGESGSAFAGWRDARLARPAAVVLRVTQIGVWVVILAAFVPTMLAIFPRTRAIAEAISGFLRQPLAVIWEAFIDYLPNLGFVVVIAVLAWAAIRALHWFFAEVARGAIRLPQFEAQWSNTTANLLSTLVLVLALVMAFPYLPGSGSPAFQGIGIFLGLLLSLSSSSAVANIVSGVIQTYTGSFETGDVVRIGETQGLVVSKGLLATHLRTPRNEEVSIPNAVVLGAQVVNLSMHAQTSGLILQTTVTIGYDVPWRQVHALLTAAAADVEGLTDEPPPFVLQTALNDFHVSYQLNVYARDVRRLPWLYSDLHRNIQDRFSTAGVEIMSPAYHALRDGNAVTIPGDPAHEDGRPAAMSG